MSCFAPLKAWRSIERTATGKRALDFSHSPRSYTDMPLQVPCGYCIGCRLDQARAWTIRCMHEADMHHDNCFITLTYADDPVSLNPKHIQDFIKRLRFSIFPTKIRYLQCGEYGDEGGRPHHHMLCFGWIPKDLEPISGGDYPLYTSQKLFDLWGHGYITVGMMSNDSIAYTCRYTLKKLGVDPATRPDGKHREYITMSRKPGIGEQWVRLYVSDISYNGTVLLNGYEVKNPRFYDNYLDKIDDKILLDIKKKRIDNSINKTPTQNYVSQQVAKIRQASKKRSYDVTRSRD